MPGWSLNYSQTCLQLAHTGCPVLVSILRMMELDRLPGDSSQPLYYGIYLTTQLDPYGSVFDICKILLLVNVLM